MPLIEGIGDEVTALIACLLIVVILTVAWMSTRVSTVVHTSVVIIDRERFAELLQRVRGVAVRSSSFLLHTAAPTAVSPPQTDGTDAAEGEPVVSNGPDLIGSNAVDAADENVVGVESLSPIVQSHETQLETAIDNTADSSTTIDSCSVDKQRQQCTTESINSTEPSSGPPAAESNDADMQQDTEQPAAEATSSHANPPDGCIEIRLQFVDGRQRTVFANPDETIGNFKRCHFAAELASNSVVRFIAGGQELRDDTSTLRSHRLSTSGAVVHCLVTPARTTPSSTSNQTTSRQLDIGILMFPLFGSILAGLWYARVMYRGYFNGTSTFSLLAISFLYLVALLASFRAPTNPEHLQQQQHAHVD